MYIVEICSGKPERMQMYVSDEGGLVSTEMGVLDMRVCNSSKDGHRKVILKGDVLGSEKGRRRVIKMPLAESKPIEQLLPRGESLILRRVVPSGELPIGCGPRW